MANMQIDPKGQYDYNKHISVYISDYIKFADGKAGVAFGVSVALFVFFGNELKEGFQKASSWNELFSELTFMLFLSLVGIGIGIYYLISTMWPRYYIDKSVYHSWGGIAAFEETEYRQTLKNKFQDEQTFLNNMMDQNHAIASICKTKYEKLRRGFEWVVYSAILGGIVWFFSG